MCFIITSQINFSYDSSGINNQSKENKKKFTCKVKCGIGVDFFSDLSLSGQ